jgi:NAD dependent epimerase/dehydratase family enzyme
VRVVHPRLGVVLTPRGGALLPMLRAARLGVGGPLGSGRQWWPWVTLDDAARALAFAIDRDTLAGPCVVAAGSVRQRELAAAIGRVLGRPALVPAPAFALRLLLGGMADGMLLAGQRVRPVALERAGFVFHDPELEPALRVMLGGRRKP